MGIERQQRWWIRQRWLWWEAVDPDETLATTESPTHHRAFTREGLTRRLGRIERRWREASWTEIPSQSMQHE